MNMTGGEAVGASLQAHGVEVVFGFPGNHTIPIYEALRRQDAVRHVLVRHEQAAAFMADGYARSSGRTGVCLTTAGPGAPNTTTAVAEAHSDRIPMVVLTAQVDTHMLGKGAYHDVDLASVFGPLTKWHTRAHRCAQIPALLAQAVSVAQSPPPGPVHLELPHDVLEAEDDIVVAPPIPPAVLEAPAADVARAADMLREAKMPLILAGGGLASAGACTELREFAERLGAPVVTTCMGKGALPDDHPLAIGVSQGPVAREYFELADLLVAVGCRFRQVSTRGWSLPIGALIHVDADPTAFGTSYTPDIAITADARSALRALLEHIRRDDGGDDWPWAAHLPVTPPPTPRGARDTLHAHIADELRAALPPDAILCLDVCILSYRLVPRFAVRAPRSLLYPAAYIAMGYGLPAAIGAKMAHPDRAVACVAGDGGFLMTGVELATVAAQDLAIPIILFNDSCLQSVRGTHESRHDGHSFGVELHNPDFVAFAASFGIDGCRVTEPEDIQQAIQRAVEH
ncbi:MAG: thiamine pyrophosphate-binding protein, partial [Armatimonadota bacterium]